MRPLFPLARGLLGYGELERLGEQIAAAKQKSHPKPAAAKPQAERVRAKPERARAARSRTARA